MAVTGKEVEILGIGTTPIQYSNGAFVLNMLHRKGGWEVRKGFGQRAEYTTTFGTRFFDGTGAGSFSSAPQGMLAHLGSHLYRTIKYRQIISVFASAFIPANQRDGTSAVNAYLVEIYDIDTGVRWEESIYPQTGQNDRATTPTPDQHGVYETSRDEDYSSFDHGRAEPFFFTEHEDCLFFGSPSCGMLMYKPTRFKETRIQQTERVFARSASNPNSESSIIRRIDPMNGTAENQLAFEYLTATSIGRVSDMASMGFATVVASGNALFFSDDESPFAFTSDNVVPVPTKFDILAIQEILGNLLIWTESETWHYTPSQGNIKSAGRLTKISDLIGCAGPQSVTKMEQGVAWVDRNGIYATQNGLKHQTISEPIKSFFNEFITNPVTSFYQSLGVSDLTNQQPNSFYSFDLRMVNLAHSPTENILIASFPAENIAMTMTDGKWAVWTFESNVFTAGGTSEVGVESNISNPYIVSDAQGMFCVGSVQSEAFVDEAKEWNSGLNVFVDVNDDVEARSYYLMEYGRGGAIDRSVDNEDYRKPRGQYNVTGGAVNLIDMVIGKWEKLSVGYTLPGGTVVDSNNDVFLLPLSLLESGSGALQTYVYSFTFDSAQWEPVVRAGTAEVDIIVPAERRDSASGYGGPGAQVPNVSEVQVYLLPAGVPDANGQEVRISWSDAAMGGPAGTVSIQRLAGKKVPTLFIPMRRRVMTSEVSGMGLNQGPPFSGMPFWGDSIFWEQQEMGSLAHSDDNVAQPVDWAYKSVQVGLDSPARLKARGLYVQILSHGKGVTTDHLKPDWLWGVFNTLLAGDFRGWTSQIIDYSGTITGSDQIQEISDKQTIRSRILDSSSNLVNKTFNQLGVTYGNPANINEGTYLIDNEEKNVIATSDSTKGDSITYMVFGHMQNRAQKIHIDSIKAVLREVGGRRRYGR